MQRSQVLTLHSCFCAPPGVDPKSVVCEFFRAGQCTKGFKCKYSHDLNVERKVAKIGEAAGPSLCRESI